MRQRVFTKSPVQENCTPGSVRGLSGNRQSYRDLRGWFFALAICGISKTSADVFFSEFRIVAENLFVRHTGGKPPQDVSDGNPHTPNACAAPSLAWFDRDDVLIIHA